MTENKWSKPKKVTGLDMAFGGDVVGRLMPAWEEIPEAYKKANHPWVKLASTWFFNSLPKETEFEPREGVDATIALRQISACLASFDMKHEHKEAGTGYLLHLFFKYARLPDGTVFEAGEPNDRKADQAGRP